MKPIFAEACQNTFVLFDCLDKVSLDIKTLYKMHSILEEEKRDDALILTQGSFQEDTYKAKMLVLGLDGTFGEFCGNGSRCVAAYLFHRFHGLNKLALNSNWGLHPLQKHADNLYSITLPMPRFDPNPQFITYPKKIEGIARYIEMIEPHLVLSKQCSDKELYTIGKTLNKDKELFPHGINVNVYYLHNQRLHVTTYERGVQRLTKSCGTGSVASLASLFNTGKHLIQTPGGLLEITFEEKHIRLKGPANCSLIK